MADIPLNLDLDQFLAPSYSNFPRFADHTAYDTVLRAFVLPEYVLAAEKARKAAIKTAKSKPTPAKKKGKTDEEAGEPRAVEELSFDRKFLCERAKSGISRCRKCGQPIPKDSIRFGYGSPDPRGEYGAIPIWFHIRCAPLGFVGFERFDDSLASMCVGFETLSDEEKKEVVETAGKGVLPSSLLGSDADDYAGEFEDEPLSAKLVHRRGVSVPLLPAPVELTGANLLPFQQEGFSWMMAQETNSSTRGGILADEMGMGKTLQTISLILATRAAARPTLVVCPVAAVMQWYSEIQKFTCNSDILSIHVYHGSQKITAEELMEYDVVLTTYQTLEYEYRKQANKAKVACKYCKKMFLPGKLSFHLKYMCGPNAMRTLKQSMREIKDKGATEKAKRTMGIESSSFEPPTISNVLREVVRESGLLSDDQLEGMTQYDLMRLYGQAAKGDIPEGKEEVKTEQDDSELRDGLKKRTVAQLKEILSSCGISNFSASAKKEDLVQLVIQNGLGKLKPGTLKGEPRSRKRADTQPSTGRRSAALKALTVLKADSSDASFSEEEKPRRKQAPAKRQRRKAVSSSEESSSDWESEESSSSDSSSSLTDSESSGETIDVLSGSDDSGPKRTGRGGKRQPKPVAPQKPRFNGDEALEDSDEEAIEDIDLNQSALHSVKWGRLVLDEAHRIKQRTNSTSMAAFALAANFRWCLSGTPLQNRVGELYSLVRFLRFVPFAHYFCKGCDCKSLHFRFIDNRFCQKCGCARTKHYSYFKQVISGPIVKFGIGDGVALNVLKTQVLDTILLRRTKAERQADLNLPSMTVEVRKLQLTDEERDFYESLYKQSMLKFDTYAKSGTLLHNYAHIFDLLTRLRQALDHPYLIVYGSDYTVPTALTQNARGICALCQDDIGDEARAVANCGHKFHSDCVREYLKEAPQLATGGCGCPACFVPLTVKFEEEEEEQIGNTPLPGESMLATPEEVTTPAEPVIQPTVKPGSIVEKVGASSFQTSSKIEALISELGKIPATCKVLVFSQFTRMLDLIDFRLKQSGFGCAKLTGSQSMAQRTNIIVSFNTDPTVRALLISLKAGGEGLNLQVADHVFLVDVWWNPACELQAIQRAHRIGQTKPVKAIRFVTENSVEEKVVALQEMKQLVFDATVGQSEGAEKKLTEGDLRFLFQH
jgi:DNA repair protein RAD16